MIVNSLEYGFAISVPELSVISYLKLLRHLLIHFLLHLSREKIKIDAFIPRKIPFKTDITGEFPTRSASYAKPKLTIRVTPELTYTCFTLRGVQSSDHQL